MHMKNITYLQYLVEGTSVATVEGTFEAIVEGTFEVTISIAFFAPQC
jgi:hypothetical protein